MNTVSKIDGFGTRRSGTSDVQNFDARKRIVDMYFYMDDGAAASTDLKTGDVVALEVNAGAGYQITVDSTATDAKDYWGYGNAVTLANSAVASHLAFTCGVYIGPAIAVKAGEWARVQIQVGGVIEIADGGIGVANTVVVGDRIIVSGVAGEATDEDTSVASIGAAQNQVKFAIAITAAASNATNKTSATAGDTCTAYLLNHLQL